MNTIRRRGGVGLRGLDASRASAGLILFTAMIGDGTVYLIDLSGEMVHQWRMPYPPGMYGYLTATGTLFYNGKIPNDTFLGRAPFKGGVALEADWNGRSGNLPLVAYSTEYVSGITTFLVANDGEVYEKDLGNDTQRTAEQLKERPASGWNAVQ